LIIIPIIRGSGLIDPIFRYYY